MAPNGMRQEYKDQNCDYGCEDCEDFVLALYKGVCAIADQARDFGDSFVLLRLMLYPNVQVSGKRKSNGGKQNRDAVKHCNGRCHSTLRVDFLTK